MNKHRGEISAEFNGESYTLVLNLGALAALEAAFEASDLNALVLRFEKGNFSSHDIMAILGAALRGGGHTLTQQQLENLNHAEGAVGMVRIVAQLLSRTFGAAPTSHSDAAQQSPPLARPS